MFRKNKGLIEKYQYQLYNVPPTLPFSVGLIISAANLGMISALPSGMLVLRYDPRWLSGAAFCLSTVSCALIWGTTYHLDFYKQYFFVLAIFYFLLGKLAVVDAGEVSVHRREEAWLLSLTLNPLWLE